MQHNNNLHGKVNKQYHKDIDLPTTESYSTNRQQFCSDIQYHPFTSYTTDSFDSYAPSATPLEDPYFSYELTTDTPELQSSTETIQTEAFDVLITPSINLFTTTSNGTSTTSPFMDLGAMSSSLSINM